MIRPVQICVLALFAVASCLAQRNHEAGPAAEELSRITHLPQGLAIDGASLDRSSAMLAANVLLTNKTSNKVRLKYDFTWVDVIGNQVGTSSSPSREVTLQRFETRTLRETAPLPAAIDYRINIRRP